MGFFAAWGRNAALAMAFVVTMASMQAQAQNRYGSIAFSQQGDGGYQWGFTWDFESREVARNRAIAECRSKGGRSCSEIFWFRNTCGALAIGGANGWGAGAGATTLEAQRSALEQCRTTNRNCRLSVSRCAKASATVASAGSLSSAKAGSAAPQRNVASRGEAELAQAGRRQIQQALAASGFSPGGADGIFGPKTRTALRAWQTANGYAATGQLTSEQIRILQSGKRRTRPVDAPALAADQGHVDAQVSPKRIVNARRKNPGFVTPPPPKRNLAEIMRAESTPLDRVAQLLKEGLDPNSRDQGGDTPLHYAAADVHLFDDRPDVVSLLISAGARCDARSNDGDTPLHVAAGTGDGPFYSDTDAVETVRLLLDCGADPNRRNNKGNTPLHTAFTGTDIIFSSGGGDFGVVDALLREGAKPNAKNNDGDTPLILAVQETDQHAKAVRVLLQHGANPDTRNREGSAALHLAAEEERPSVIAALLAGGADPDAKDKQGDTALHIVAKKRRERAKDVEALLAGGADPCVRDRKRNIPIAYPEEGSRANRLLASAGGLDWDCDEKTVAEATKQKREEPKREVTEPEQREQLTPKCREYLASVEQFYELWRRNALSYYDGEGTGWQADSLAVLERLEAIATSLGADFQTATAAASAVYYEKAPGSTAAEAKGNLQGALDASRAAFLKEAGVCQS